MKRILLLSLLLLPIVALAQYPTFSNKQKLGVQTTGDGLIFRGTTINNIPNYTPSNVNNAYFHLDTVQNKLYLYNANAWQLVYPSPQFDTTTLNVYLKISDTTAMLLPYFRDSDTTSLNLINRFALKLNISDTATMLTPYMKKADTISLSNRINLKLNISDTIILSNRITTNANNIITINNKLATKLDTIYVKFKNVVTRLLNKDTINIGSSLTDGYAINIIGDSVNIDTVILDTRYPDRDSTNELQDITFATTSGIVTISGGKVMNLDTLYNSVIDSVNLLIKDSIAAFTPLTEGYGINIIGDSINVDTTVIFTQSDTITLSNRINTKLNASDTASLSNRINNKLDTIYVNYQTNVDVVTNKDTINIIPLTEGFGINIIGDSINIDSSVILETQQKQIAYVKNQSGVTMYKGQAVYSSGSSGSNKLVTLASSNTESSSSKTFGIVETDSIPNGGHGYVITFGVLSGFNTNALTEGLTVYLSSTPGQLTSVKPIAPLNLVTIGICIRQQQNNGSIFVKIQNGFEFDELHDVRITTPVDKASIYYNLSENLWRDTTATLLVSDTASMLNPYLRKLDTILLSNRIDLRVKYADTTNMLLPYFRTNDTTLLNLNSRLSIKLNLSDTANMLSKYVNTYSNQIDINGNKTFNNVVTIDSATVTGKLLVNTNISDAVKINSNTNSTNLELMNSGGSVFIKSENKNMTLQTGTTALVYLKGDVNKVGILTMNPEQALQVSGTIRVDSLVNNLTPDKLVGANNSNDLTDIKIGNGLSFLNDTLKVADNIINSGDTATLLRQDFLGINTNVLTWQQGSKKLLPYFTQVYRNGQLLKSESQYTITNDSIVTLATGSFKLDDNITIIAIDNIVALAGSGSMITLQGDVTGNGTNSISTTIGTGKVLNSMLAGSITNDKLDVITATNKVSNSATTATSANTGNTIVSRDNSGNFSAGIITASLNGNAATVTTNANLTGDVTSTGNATSIATGVIVNADINASAAIAVSKLAASTISGVTLGNNLNTLTISSPLTGTSYNGSSAVSIGIPAATSSINGYLTSTDWTTFNNKQNQLNGNGFVKASGISITYDNSTYLTTGTAASTYLPLTGGTLTGKLSVLDSISIGSLSQYTGNFTRYLKTANVSPYIDLNIGSVGTIGTWRGRINFQTSYNTEVPTTAMTINEFGNINMNGTLGVTGATTLGSTLAVNSNGVPFTANSTNANTNKISLSDNGIIRSYLGANNAKLFTVANSSTTELMFIDNNGVNRINASGVPMQINSTNSNINKIAFYDAGANTGYIASSLMKPFIVNNSLTTEVASISDAGNASFAGNITEAGNNVLTNLDTASLSSRIDLKQNALTNPVTGTGTNNFIPKFTSTGSTISNSTIQDNGTTVSTSSILSTTNYASFNTTQVMSNSSGILSTHRFTSANANGVYDKDFFLTSYMGAPWQGSDVGSGNRSKPPIVAIVNNNDPSFINSGLHLMTTNSTNNTYTPAITFGVNSENGSYYNTIGAITAKKLNTGNYTSQSAGQLEFFGTGTALDATGASMTTANMTLGVGVGIGYTTAPTVRGRLIVSEKLGINQSTPNFTLDVSGTANITGATTLGSTLNVTGITTVNNVLTINSGASNGLLLNGTNDQNIKIYSSNISGNAGIFYQNATTGQTQGIDGLFVGVIGQIGSYFINSENTKSYLYTNGNENQLVLDTDGNVGIGISDATNKLDINGTLRVRTTNTVAPTSILGRDNNGIVGGIIVGNGLTLSNSTLSLVSSGGFITTNSNYTVTITDTWIVFNNNFSNITVTLPDASTSTGRTLYFRNTAAGSIVSAGTANIIDNTITTGTPNNNILGAGNTNVKWCTLVSNGQYWIKMQAGSL